MMRSLQSLLRVVMPVRVLSAAVGAVLVTACDERATVQPPRPVAAPVPAYARLVLSDSGARVGEVVGITAWATLPEGGAVGSFTARLLYDSLQLSDVEADFPEDGALRVLNPIRGEYRLAGAGTTGLPGGLLFRVKATVRDPKGLRRIGLAIDEMHSTGLAPLTEKLEVLDGRAELFAGRGVKVQPTERRP